jgi:NAD(P)-dependent dehydrogenase (short-subunit alcohol dehydrogenase family)
LAKFGISILGLEIRQNNRISMEINCLLTPSVYYIKPTNAIGQFPPIKMNSEIKKFVTKHPYLSYGTLGAVGGYLGLYTLANYIVPFLKRRVTGLTSTSTGEDVLGQVTDKESLSGAVAIVTGGNVGLGKETARVLAKAGIVVVLAGRNVKSLEAAKQEILLDTKGATVHILELDLADQKSIHKSVSNFKDMGLALDILILNAGYMSPARELTKDGFETSIGVNHLGHFTFTNLLVPLMRKTSTHEKRIVVLGSELHRRGPNKILWDDFQMEKPGYPGLTPTYSHSKLANLMFTLALNRRFEKDGIAITANCAHPGIIATELHRNDFAIAQLFTRVLLLPLWGLTRKSLQAGVSTTVYGAIHPELKGRGGHYLSNCGIGEGLEYAYDVSEQEKLWELSEKLTGVNYTPE